MVRLSRSTTMRARGSLSALEASANPFATVVLAHLKARETASNPADRYAWKARLVRGLYERGLGARDGRELFRVIDWLMILTQGLDDAFWDDAVKIQEEKQMPFITTLSASDTGAACV